MALFAFIECGLGCLLYLDTFSGVDLGMVPVSVLETGSRLFGSCSLRQSVWKRGRNRKSIQASLKCQRQEPGVIKSTYKLMDYRNCESRVRLQCIIVKMLGGRCCTYLNIELDN